MSEVKKGHMTMTISVRPSDIEAVLNYAASALRELPDERVREAIDRIANNPGITKEVTNG